MGVARLVVASMVKNEQLFVSLRKQKIVQLIGKLIEHIILQPLNIHRINGR